MGLLKNEVMNINVVLFSVNQIETKGEHKNEEIPDSSHHFKMLHSINYGLKLNLLESL